MGSQLVYPSPAPLALSLEDPSTSPSASEAQTPPRPSGSTMASSSLVSTGARQSTNSTGLPCPSGSTFTLRILGFILALRLSFTPSGSTCSAAVFGPLESAAIPPPWLLPLSAPPWLLTPSFQPWTLLVILFPGVRPLPEPYSSVICLPSCQPFAAPCHHPTSTPLSSHPPPRSPSAPTYVSMALGRAFREGGELSHP